MAGRPKIPPRIEPSDPSRVVHVESEPPPSDGEDIDFSLPEVSTLAKEPPKPAEEPVGSARDRAEGRAGRREPEVFVDSRGEGFSSMQALLSSILENQHNAGHNTRAAETLRAQRARFEPQWIHREGYVEQTFPGAVDELLLDGVGSTPLGGKSVTFLRVPSAPTPDFRHRYLGHLISIFVPSNCIAYIRLRQAILIGLYEQAEGGEAVSYEFEQESPFWSFRDGNVTWYMRYFPGNGPLSRLKNGPLFPGSPNFSGDMNTADTAWLANAIAPAYVPPNGGVPPGRPWTNEAVIQDLRWPWTGAPDDWTNWPSVVGPCRIAVYVSVAQTNPSRNVGPQPTPAPVPKRPEDQFVRDNPGQVRYTGIAAALLTKYRRFR